MRPKAEAQARQRNPPPFIWALLVTLAVANLTVVTLAWSSLARSRAQHVARAEVATQNLCDVLADDIINSYQKIDLSILAVKDVVELQLASAAVDGAAFRTFVNDRRLQVPLMFGMRIADAEGNLEIGNEGVPGARISISDRDYFKRLKRDPSAGLVISKPVEGRLIHKLTLIFARRLNRQDGAFAGVVFGSLELGKLGTRFATLSLGREGSISLWDRDLDLIVRQQDSDKARPFKLSPAFVARLRGQGRIGTFTAVAEGDGVERIQSFIKLDPFPQVLVVGLGKAEQMGPWRRERDQTIAFTVLFFILSWSSAFLAHRSWVRQRDAEAARERVIAELQGALAEVNVLSGLLPICSHCKKIRDDGGYWNQIETYITSRSSAHFTHGICPDCARELYPEVYEGGEGPQASGSGPGREAPG